MSVIEGAFYRGHAARLADELVAHIHTYDDKLYTIEVLGILEVVKASVLADALEGE